MNWSLEQKNCKNVTIETALARVRLLLQLY